MQPLLVGDVLSLTARRAPRRVAASLAGRLVTFAELEAATTSLVRVLGARGVGAGDRVVWWGETTLDAIPLWFAVARLGAAFVPVNPRLTPIESGALLDRVDAALIVSDDARPGQVDLAALTAEERSTGVAVPDVDERQPHVIFFTSGSSGRPKGVELSHRASRLRVMTDSTQMPNGPTVCMFPQFHMAGWYGPMTGWANADEVVYVDRADAEPLLRAVHERRATRLYAIPAVWRRILATDRRDYDLSCLRVCDTGTSATTPELLAEIADAFPGSVTSITYGSTEAGGVCRLWPEDIHRKAGSVGLAGPGCELRLRPDDGELLVRNPFLMNGYFRDEEATAAALADGWFHTGDLAERDDEGYYRIVGRAKEIIRTGGETVAPAEVDEVIGTISSVVDVAVAGVPDAEWGEVITAFVVLRPGARLSLAELRAHCADRLAPFKHPRRLVVVDGLPRTGATRQVQRAQLVQWALDPAGAVPGAGVSGAGVSGAGVSGAGVSGAGPP